MTDRTRTDEQVKADVADELRWDPRVDASRVRARVDDGVVTLTGTLPSLGARTAVVAGTSTVRGVKGVNDRLTVAYPPPVPDDALIRSAVEIALGWDPGVKSTDIQISVNGGVVRLMGTVPTHRDRTDAEAVVGRLRGVRAVTNELTVILTESHSDETIAADIVSALKRSALVDAGRVDVTVSDGTVTLEGKVRTAAAKSAAYRAADRTAGVIRVADKLTLGFGNGSVGN